ncbi:MAG: HipA domain-containing protein [Egibacteraceae bacterium]
MSDIEVLAQVADDPAVIGRLHPHRPRGRAVSSTFVYDPGWTARPDGFDLDPATPRGTGPVQTPAGHVLPRALADCAPDRWGRTLRMQEERLLAEEEGRAARTLDDIDFLLGVRDDLRQGDLRLRDGGDFQRLGGDVPLLTDLGELLDLANRAMDEDLGAAEIARLVRQGSSLGGARPKTHVQDAAGRLGIAKFPAVSVDSWDVMAWEKVCLDLAESAGIAVPGRQLLDIAGRRVLVVARFDRVHRPGRAPARVGYRSALTMCERSDGDAGSYLEIAEVVEEHSPHATEDLRQLWRRVVFNVLVTNTDDHLRNHAFLQERAGAWQLSPAFDLNPNPDAGPSPALHTAIDEYATDADLDLVMEVAPLFRLDEPSARQMLREVAEAVEGWRHAAHRCGLDDDAVRRMAPAFDHPRLRRALAC